MRNLCGEFMKMAMTHWHRSETTVLFNTEMGFKGRITETHQRPCMNIRMLSMHSAVSCCE